MDILFLWNVSFALSLCTRFSGFSTISSFSFNRLSSKLVSMFFEIVPMFVLKDFVRDRSVAQICAKMCVCAGIRATKLSRISRSGTKSLSTNIGSGTIPKNIPTNFELKRLKLKLDIVKKPKNRVHKLTDSNVFQAKQNLLVRTLLLYSNYPNFEPK